MPVSRSLVTVTVRLVVSAAIVMIASAKFNLAEACAAPPADGSIADPPEEESGARRARKPQTAGERANYISIQGTVLGDDGRPARWSRVWLLGMTKLPGSRFGAAEIEGLRADKEGRFEFWHPRWRDHNPGPDEYSVLWVLARTRDGTLTTNEKLNLTSEFRGKSEIHDLKLKALPKEDYSGRIVDGDGKPIPNANVTPEFLILRPPEGKPVSTMAWPPELAADYAAVTDANGRFTLSALPRSKNILAQISAPSLGTRGMFWATAAPPELQFVPGGTIRGRLTNPPDSGFFSQIEMSVNMAAGPRIDSAEPGVAFYAWFRPDADGNFEIANVPPGTYQVGIAPGRGGPTVPREFFTPVVCEAQSAGLTEGIEIALPNVIVARGRVVDRETGTGIAGAVLNFYEDQERRRSIRGTATTNARGEYQAYLRPGKIAIDFGNEPAGYLTPLRDSQQSASVMRAENFEAPELLLERALKFRGTVVDQDGRPVAGADVRWIQPGRVGQGMPPNVTSDESGGFVIPQIDPRESLPLRVRTPTAVSTAILVEPAALGRPQQVVIAPENAFRLRGTVIDESGQPVSGAAVAVHWHRSYASKRTRMSGRHGEFEKKKTDERGQFEFAALWPEDGYNVVIEAAGFSKTDLPNVKGKSGETYDYGTVTLNGASRAISGRVVDPDGKPVADVTVFNSGDAPRIVTTLSGKDGRFRLDGLLAGPVYVFAEHDQYRLAGAYVKRGANEAVLTLTPRAAPPPAPQAVDFGALEAVRRQQAEQVLEWIKGTNLSLRPNLQGSRFAALARTDPAEALKQIGQQSPAMDYRSALLIARSLTPFQPRKDPLDANDKKNVEVALKFVDRLDSRIDDLVAGRRLHARAETGLMFLRLGDGARGRPLVETAAKEWSANGSSADSLSSDAVVTIAQGLAWTDAARALGYLETVSDENLKTQIHNRVIVEVSRFDVVRALALLNDPKYAPARDADKDSLKVELAYRIGKVDPQKAAELATGIASPFAKPNACGWTALAIADEAPELARSLIDQGFKELRNHRTSSPNSFYYEYVPGMAAQLALHASQIKHPEIETIIQQVLALRIPADSQTSMVSRLKSTLDAALILALIDPAVARRLLTDLEPALNGNLLGDGGYAAVARRDWYIAWILADPEHAARLLQARMEKTMDAKDINPQSLGVQDALTFMALPPTERLDFIQTVGVAGFFKPYRD
jgi:protocatechuate 3,4-dioxygenase beta subunit